MGISETICEVSRRVLGFEGIEECGNIRFQTGDGGEGWSSGRMMGCYLGESPGWILRR